MSPSFRFGFARLAVLLLAASGILGLPQPGRAGPARTQGGAAARLAPAEPQAVGMSAAHLSNIDLVVRDALDKKLLPGAVVLVGRRGRVIWRRAYGRRSIQPTSEAMTPDTVFDLASLTKVVATAPSVMLLVERDRLLLSDPVARHIPEFGSAGKEAITIEQLLTHRSGLPATSPLADYRDGTRIALQRIYATAPESGSRGSFRYSDLNYMVLGDLVARLSGRLFEDFVHSELYAPLGMSHTGFVPLRRFGLKFRGRIAPSDQRPDLSADNGRSGSASPAESRPWIRGEVHDPRAYLMGGIAGHAGVFSTADDLAAFCQMFLNEGTYGGRRVISALGVRRMLVGAGSGTDGVHRGLGWDIHSGYSANKGDLLGGYGHSGFTGVSLWLDPTEQLFVVFLSNRLHPTFDARTALPSTWLSGRIASIVAASIEDPAP